MHKSWSEYETPKFTEPSDRASKARMEEHLRFCLDGDIDSELWGENGLIAATMNELYHWREANETYFL